MKANREKSFLFIELRAISDKHGRYHQIKEATKLHQGQANQNRTNTNVVPEPSNGYSRQRGAVRSEKLDQIICEFQEVQQ